MLFLTVAQKDGRRVAGEVLFTSETNNVAVKFTSDHSLTRSGFSLDVRSISCENHGSCDAEEVQIDAGDVLQDALVTHTDSDGEYPNHACQEWSINTDENQVYICCFLFKVNDRSVLCFKVLQSTLTF